MVQFLSSYSQRIFWTLLLILLSLFLVSLPDQVKQKENDCDHYQSNEKKKACLTLKGSRAKKEELAEWVYSEHLDNFCKVAHEQSVMITVRKTGAHSIKRIAEGGATKGHDILDKTLKPKSLRHLSLLESLSLESPWLYYPKKWLKNKNTLSGSQLKKRIESLELEGYVGWWVKNNKGHRVPVGVYTVYSACSSFSSQKKIIPEGGCRLTFKELLAQKNKVKDIMTGDYDLHDIIALSNEKPPHKIPSAFTKEDCLDENKEQSCEVTLGEDPRKEDFHNYGNFDTNCDVFAAELRVACHLNRSIQKERNCLTEEASPGHCGVIRHGAQANYLQYQKVTGERLIPALVDVDSEIAVIEPLFDSKKNCQYYLLGKNPEKTFLEEYEALYQISESNFGTKRSFTYLPEALALENARKEGVPEPLLKMEQESILLELEALNEELQASLKEIHSKKNLSLEKDCLEKLYEMEAFARLLKDSGSKNKKFKQTLSRFKSLLCEESLDGKNKTCLDQMREESKNSTSSKESWEAMKKSFCG